MQLGAYRGAGGETVFLLKEMILRQRGGGDTLAIFRDGSKEIAMRKLDFQVYYEKIDDPPVEEEKEEESIIDLLTDMRDLLSEIRNDTAEINYNTPNTR